MAYDPVVGAVLRSIKKPVADLRWCIREMPDGLLAITVYENQIMGYNDAQRQDILEYLNELKRTLISLGFRAGLDGQKGDPPGRFIS